MTRNSGKPCREDVPLHPLPDHDPETETGENGWGTATRRVLLYLKALGFPPRDSLHLAEEALDCAEREADTPPVRAAMITLRSYVYPGGAPVTGPSPGWTSGGAPNPRTTMAVPPPNPGRMTPARIDRRPWLTFLLCFARRCRSFLSKGGRRRESGVQQALQTRSMGPRLKGKKRHAP